jgi:hypothetical protein
MKTLVTLAVATLGLAALPGCILVATDHCQRSPTQAELDAVRQVEVSSSAPSIRTDYKEQLAKLTPGMSVDSFRAILPGALFVEQKQDGASKLDAYSLKLEEPYHVRGVSVIMTAKDEAWFYFRDGGFVKWGEPSKWP